MTLNIQQSIFSELADFLVSQPSLDSMASYQMPPGIQQHLDHLLDLHQEDRLTSEERLELEKILVVADVMNLVKVKARLKVHQS